MRSYWALLTVVFFAIAGTNSFVLAELLVNGDFEAGSNWASKNGQSPVNWFSSFAATSTNGNYGESITGYGNGRVAAIKGVVGNYYQQVISGVDAEIADLYTVTYDGGIRWHSSYPATARDITLRVSLWDTTDDVELAGHDVVTPFLITATSLESRTHDLSYNNTGLAGHDLALRFTNSTDPVIDTANANTILLDNITLTSNAIIPVRLVSPTDGEPSESIDADPTLAWIPGTDHLIDQHVLYFSTDQNWVANALPTDDDAVVLDVSVETYLHNQPLEYETTYYWRVDEACGNLSYSTNIETGPVWSFTTRLIPPPQCAGNRFDGDIDGDCFVDIADLMLFSQNWMLTSVVSDADINEDTNVDNADFSYISRDWLTDIRSQLPSIMFISAHPDDEGIFFGGAIPYYAQVLGGPVVHISVTSGDWMLSNLSVREAELTNADEIYFGRTVTTSASLIPDPSADLHFLRFRDVSSGSFPNVDQVWDWWNDGVYDSYADSLEGEQKVINTLVAYIRVFKPIVIATHDFDGEYGHSNHRATASAVADAYDRAADPSYVDGNEPWQAKKLYVHQSVSNGLGTTGRIFEGWLFHDFWEELTIDGNGDGIDDMTPRQVADLGLNEHISQGRPDVNTVYRTGENYGDNPGEWWGLYRSEVGPDTIADDFSIVDETYSDWAIGNFFENL